MEVAGAGSEQRKIGRCQEKGIARKRVSVASCLGERRRFGIKGAINQAR